MFRIDDVSGYRLHTAPLRQALAQVRFPLLARLQTLEGVAPLQERLLSLFPYMERRDVAEMGVKIGVGLAPQTEVGTTTTWEMTDDEGTLVSLGPGIATLSSGPEYQDVEWFGERFRAVLEALEGTGVRRCDRLGVRYLDLAEPPPGDAGAWARWFRPELVGWIGEDLLREGSQVRTSVAQTLLVSQPVGELSACPGDVEAVIRHGPVPAGSVIPGIPPVQLEREAFVLDIDVFVAVGQPFVPQALVDQFSLLHAQIDRFFRWSLTPEGEEYFGLEEADAVDPH